jgi:hypothetical protein
MQKNILLLCATLIAATLFTGCGQTMPSLSIDTEDECQTINKKLLKVDKFTKTVNATSAFHLEEAAAAVTTPGITASNNKRQMLRDAKKKKAALEAEHQKLGCETTEQ